MLASYLAEIEFPFEAHVVEVGCGTGHVSRRLANCGTFLQVSSAKAVPAYHYLLKINIIS
ncbi:MAG: class I SAM-dependent methyltransferase [Desulfobulbaceae bacterium]|nr:class I SAM-dependent methyltransferase [Desulfobulbaceae bacterium]